MSLRLPPQTSLWNRIKKVVNVVMSGIIRPTSPPSEEPPRKRRRKAQPNKAGYKMPSLEERNAHIFREANYIIDGPYRRVPPFFYVHSILFCALIDRLIILGRKNGGIMFLFLKFSATNFGIDNLNITE